MKHLYTYIILLFSTFSCSSHEVTNVEIESLRDSVGHLIQYGLLEEDTIMLRRALLLTDSLINIESDKNAKKYVIIIKLLFIHSLVIRMVY